MKPKFILSLLLIAALAGAGGWLVAKKFSGAHEGHGTQHAAGTRKILHYQSSMHPWIKSDKPGRCTICGMELSPVYEGDKGFDAREGVVALDSNTIQVINVQTTPAQRRPLVRTLRVAGTVDDNDARHRRLTAYVDGRIEKLHVNHVGAEVTAGQPLAVLYSPMLSAAQSEYLTLLRAPAGNTPAAQAQHQQLVDSAALRLRRLGLTEAQVNALARKTEPDLNFEIVAPMSGTVVSREVYEGQYVKEGDKLFEVADFSVMWFLFDAYERDLVWIKPGQTVEITTPAVPGRVFSGSVEFIDPNLKEMTRSAKVRVELENPLVQESGRSRRLLLHKLYAEATVKVEAPEVLAVPRRAVLNPGGQPVVYVDKGEGAYEQRRVKLGRTGDEDYEVLDGLSEGERLVTTGNLLIDAQAQLNASVNDVGPQQETNKAPPAGRVMEKLPALDTSQTSAVTTFLSLAAALTDSLASDDLKAFNEQAPKLHAAALALTAAFTNDSPWLPVIEKISSTSHLGSANDLKSARKSFHPFSRAVVDFAHSLRQPPTSFPALKVFRCPMTKDAFPGAPRTADWIQLAAPVRNPYFGAEMLDCGSEVKP